MSKIVFRKLDKANASVILPGLFRILHTNMTQIAPTGCTYEEDEALWLSYVTQQMEQEYPEYILIFVEDMLAGYFQYRIEGNALVVDEVEIAPEYQRTMVFYRLCVYLCQLLPGHINCIECYANKQNVNSLKINHKLGLKVIGENGSGESWHLRGDADKIKRYFLKERAQ